MAEETGLIDLRRPAFRHSRAHAQERDSDADGRDVHEQGLVIGSQIMAGHTPGGQAALQPQQVAVAGVTQDHHGTPQPGHGQHAACRLQKILDAAAHDRRPRHRRGGRIQKHVQQLLLIRKRWC